MCVCVCLPYQTPPSFSSNLISENQNSRTSRGATIVAENCTASRLRLCSLKETANGYAARKSHTLDNEDFRHCLGLSPSRVSVFVHTRAKTKPFGHFCPFARCRLDPKRSKDFCCCWGELGLLFKTWSNLQRSVTCLELRDIGWFWCGGPSSEVWLEMSSSVWIVCDSSRME